MKINGQNIDGIIIYKRKYNYEMVARKLIDLGYLVAEPTDGFESLIFDKDKGGWIGSILSNSPNTISWEIFCSYDNAEIEVQEITTIVEKPTKSVDDVVVRIVKMFESNEFIQQAKKYFPENISTEDMMAELGKQIYDLINDLKK